MSFETPLDGLPPRDAARIPVVLDLIRQEWEKHPDERFMQLVDNLQDRLGVRGRARLLEDEELIVLLEDRNG